MVRLVGCLVLIGIMLLSVLIPIGIASVAILIFDWIFGTAYFAPHIVAIVALLLFICGRVYN